MKALPLLDDRCCVAAPALSDVEAVALERVFAALADRHRVKILNLLAQGRGRATCVCELVPALGVKQPGVSYHLKVLLDAGLIEGERRGTYRYYRLADGALERVRDVLRAPAAAA